MKSSTQKIIVVILFLLQFVVLFLLEDDAKERRAIVKVPGESERYEIKVLEKAIPFPEWYSAPTDSMR